jgi:hypothetical protein
MSDIPVDSAEEERTDVAEPSREEVLVNGWRFEQFSALGFDLPQVASLVYSAVDLNVARRLIAGGCSPIVAARILL